MAAIQAATRLRRRSRAPSRASSRRQPERITFRERKVGVIEDWDKAVPFAQAIELAEAMHGVLAFAGSYAPPKRAGKYKGGGVGPSPCYSYSACVVELTVDEDTGWIELDDVWIAHDIGRAFNPLLVEGQVEGSIYMGIGEALMEGQVFRKGLHKHPSMLEYKSPTTLETPEIHTYLVETDDPEGRSAPRKPGRAALAGDSRDRQRDLSRDGRAHRPGADHARHGAARPRAQAPGQARAHRPDKLRSSLQGAARGGVRLRPGRRRPVRGAGPVRGSAAMMRLPSFDYVAPEDDRAAVRALGEAGPDGMLVAGGTDLYPNMKRRQFEPKTLVGLRAIKDLRGVSGTAREGVTIGACTTLSAVATHAAIARDYPALAIAAGVVSSPQLRNMGTLGGNVCVDTRCNYYNQTFEWRKAIGFCMKKDGDICLVAPGSDRCWAVSSSDTAPVLWSLGARVRLHGPAASARSRSPRSSRTTASSTCQARRRDRHRDHAAAGRGLALGLSEAAAARLVRLSRSSASPPPCASRRRRPRGAHRAGRGAPRRRARRPGPRGAARPPLTTETIEAAAEARPARPARSTTPTSRIPTGRRSRACTSPRALARLAGLDQGRHGGHRVSSLANGSRLCGSSAICSSGSSPRRPSSRRAWSRRSSRAGSRPRSTRSARSPPRSACRSPRSSTASRPAASRSPEEGLPRGVLRRLVGEVEHPGRRPLRGQDPRGRVHAGPARPRRHGRRRC
jgi:hypothetical protein